MSDKEKLLSSIAKANAGFKGHESVLKEAEWMNKMPKSIFTSPAPFELPEVDMPELKIPKAIKELNREYKDFDVDGLIELKKKVQDVGIYSEEDPDLSEDVEDALQRFIDEYQKFKELNSEQYRKIAIKRAELQLEHQNHALKLITQEAEAKLSSKYDWKAKWRHLIIKSLGTVLFITLLLLVGWLVKTYEWAELPYSGLFKSVVPFPKP